MKGRVTGGRERCLPGLVFPAPTVKAAALLGGTSGDEEFMELVFRPSISHYTIKSFTAWKNNLWESEAGAISIGFVPL